jgi:hypothetical protein
MARIRTIKPEFFASEQVASVPYHCRLLFVGLWLHADREGRLLDRPVRLKAMLFPYDDLDINDGLDRLHRAGLITRYERGEMKLIAMPTWAKHQQPNMREAASVLPAPDEHGASTVLGPQEGKGKEQEGKGTDTALRARFDRFWEVYPRKVAKDAALKEWLKRSPDDALTDLMIAKVLEQRASEQWLKDDGKYIPHPRTWLHGGRWQDEAARVASALKPDIRGHFPPCRTNTECLQKVLGRPEVA